MEKITDEGSNRRGGFYLLLLVSLSLLVTACSKKDDGISSNKWQEEIQLSDGHIIWVDRTVRLE